MADRRFPRSARLLSPRHFEHVFRAGRRFSTKNLLATAVVSDQPAARLGLTVSKKAVSRSCDRNRLKRHIRESFRNRRTQMPAMDIVVTARNGVAALVAAELHQALDQLWTRIAQACAES